MPNHIENCLRIIGTDNQIKEVKDFLKDTWEDGEERNINFQKIIPMPEDLNIESGSVGENGLQLLHYESNEEAEKETIERAYKRCKSFNVKFFYGETIGRLKRNEEEYKKAKEMGKKYLDNYIKYGYCNWYEWCCDNWGTKWNAYKSDLEDEKDTIRFLTAWSNVFRLLFRLGVMFPDVTFEYSYADEDFGYNTGKITFKDNMILERYIPEGGSKEAYKFAAEVKKYSKDDLIEHGVNPDTFEYEEEDE